MRRTKTETQASKRCSLMSIRSCPKQRGNDNGGKIIEKIGLYRNSILWIQAAHFMPSRVAVAEFLLKANAFICCGHI